MSRPRKASRALRGKLATALGQDWRRKHFKRQDGRCFYCGEAMVKEPPNHRRYATLEHIIPLSRGGEHHWENTVCACRLCNEAKKAMLADEFLAALSATKEPKPDTPTGQEDGT